jgi:hypothetical protein
VQQAPHHLQFSIDAEYRLVRETRKQHCAFLPLFTFLIRARGAQGKKGGGYLPTYKKRELLELSALCLTEGIVYSNRDQRPSMVQSL